MTITSLILEAGISLSLVFLLFNFCMSITTSSMEMTNNLLDDMYHQDFKEIDEDKAEMDNYLNGLGSISLDFMNNFDKDELTDENIRKIKDAIGDYEETGETKELKELLSRIKDEK